MSAATRHLLAPARRSRYILIRPCIPPPRRRRLSGWSVSHAIRVTAPMRQTLLSILVLGALVATASPVSAQGFGIGARWRGSPATPNLTWIPSAFSGADPHARQARRARSRHRSPFRSRWSSSTRRSLKPRYKRRSSCAWPAAVSSLPARRTRLVSPQRGDDRGPRCERQHNRVRLACRRRPRDSRWPPLRHPRRLPVHLPRLRRDDDDEDADS